MKLTYVGPHEAVSVPLPEDGGVVTVERGKQAEFPSETAASLLDQGSDHWQKTKKQEG